MSVNPPSIDELSALYMSQSPVSLTSVAMHAKTPTDYNQRRDGASHEGGTDCAYCCCDERGCCSTPGWYAALIGGAAVTCICCCYCTNGFNGVWTYWPF